MKFTLDLAQCENHGQCAIAAPELFSLDDDGVQALRAVAEDRYTSADLSPEQAAGAALALDMCPMQAISITD